MTFLYNFGLSQEDERTEFAALEITGTDQVLSIASAGDMPLSLLALGAGRIDAVDVDVAQLHLCRLKLAAVRSLERDDAIAFLGFLPCSGERRISLLHQLLPAMPDASRRFWLANRPAIAAGAVWAGRYEQYVSKLAGVALPVLGRKRFDALFACANVEEQREVFDRDFDRKTVRAIFDIAFHPKVFSSRGMDPRSLQHRTNSVPLGEQYFSQFRDLCTATPARDNHLLQLHLLGRVLHSNAVPAYLSEEGVAAVRERAEDLQFVHSDLVSHLESLQPGAFDKAHLSNLPDWLAQDDFDHVMHLLATKSAVGSRFVWRYLHVNRPIPRNLEGVIQIDGERGAALQSTDRFPFYAIVCGTVRRSSAIEPSTGVRTRALRSDDHVSEAVRSVPTPYSFRPADRTRGDDMMVINRACPIEADFTVVFEREPDFFQWPDLIYDRYQYIGIHHHDEQVGYCMTGQLEGWTGTEYGRYFYGGDARLLSAHRGHRLAELALRHALDLLPSDVEVGFGLVKQGNHPAQRTVDTGYSERFEEARRIGFEAANVLLLQRMRRPRLLVRKARTADIDDMAELFNRTNGKRLFAPRLDGTSIQRDMQKPGLGCEQWYVVEQHGRLVGMAAAWDQSSFHRTRVLRLSHMGQALRALYGGSRILLRNAAPLPGEGESFRALTLTRIAIAGSDPAVLRDLLRFIVNDHSGRGFHMLHVGLTIDDPLRAATRGLLCQRFRSGVLVVTRRGAKRRSVWYSGWPYVDLAMI